MTKRNVRNHETDLFIQVANGEYTPPGPLPHPLPEAQENLTNLLDGIVSSKGGITDSKELRYFTGIAELYRPKYHVVTGRLIRNWGEVGYIEELKHPHWLRDLASEIIGFMCDNDLKQIKKCSVCPKYFIESKRDDRIKYCPICSPKNKMSKEERRKYQREYNAKIKHAEKESEKRQQIKRLIEAGHTEAMAEQVYLETLEADEDVN